MNVKLEMLRCFAEVVRAGNLALAAQRLGRTPSAVSMMLKQTEEQFGQPLFEGDRKNKLTEFGRFAFERAELTVSHFEETLAQIQGFANGETGVVRIASVPSFAQTILPGTLARHIARHPKVRVELRDTNSSGVAEALNKKHVDIGIASAYFTTDDFDQTPLFSDAFGVICRVDDQIASCENAIEWHQLKDRDFVSNDLCRSIADPLFQNIIGNATLSIQNTSSLLAMVRANLGITVLPELVARDLPDDLVLLPLADKSAIRTLYLLTRHGENLIPTASNLCQSIQNDCPVWVEG